jgi:hypothetical protein
VRIIDLLRSGKPAVTATQRPRLHYWEVRAGGQRYFLKRFQDWYPTEAIRYIHSILRCLEEERLPAPRAALNTVGVSFTEAGGNPCQAYGLSAGVLQHGGQVAPEFLVVEMSVGIDQ